MIPELGHLALIIAFVLAIVQGVLPLAGAALRDRALMDLGRPAAQGQCLFVLAAFGALVHAFVGNDFSVTYVASHSNSLLPVEYRVAAVWGGHEGSLLLWVTLLALWTVAVSVFSRRLPDDLVARVLAVMGLVSSGFHAFLLTTSNPFLRLLPPAVEGRDLNPLLQDPGMVFHPPMLYMGYVGFSVAFAFAIAALLSGRLDSTWARWSRPWTTIAWVFLTLGIALGSFWAYYELGWGGWWFWDPVENASFMPWLVGTALMHSLAVTERRGGFRAWTALLAICAFSLSLLGTFLVRSGVLTSVHAFATDPKRGVFILGFLAVVVGASLVLFAWRGPRIAAAGDFAPVSRESMLLANNVLLLVAAAAVLLGTLYPLALDALGLGKISVGPPYFESVFAPLMAPAIFLMGVGPVARWREADLPGIAVRLRWALAASALAAVAVPLAAGGIQGFQPMVAFGCLLAAWVATTTAANLAERLGRHPAPSLGMRLRSQPAGYYGMLLAHAGVAAFIAGVTIVKGYESEKDVRMEPGDTVTLGGHVFRFDSVGEVKGPNYVAARGVITVLREGEVVRVLHPEKRVYTANRMPMTEAAIDAGMLRDLYVALGEPVSATAWSVRVHHKPMVGWIWGGCVLMALGGVLAIADRRYRLPARRAADPAPVAATAGAAGAASAGG